MIGVVGSRGIQDRVTPHRTTLPHRLIFAQRSVINTGGDTKDDRMKTSENLKLRKALEDAIAINNAASKAAIVACNKAIKTANANLVMTAKTENAVLAALAANKIANDTLAAVMRKG